MEKKGCKGFRQHKWIDDPDDKPDPRVDYMAAFYMGWRFEYEKICAYCRLKKAEYDFKSNL